MLCAMNAQQFALHGARQCFVVNTQRLDCRAQGVARVLRTDRLEAAEAFFDRHGPMALVLGRFVPIVRTYVPLVAGTANMRYRHFALWNILGALCWVVAMTLVGVLLGGIPGIAHNIEAIMLVIVGISVAPLVVSTVRSRWAARRAAQAEQA